MSRQLDKAIKEGLRAEAESIRFTEEQSSRVLSNIHNQNNQKWRKTTMMGKGKRILIAAAAIAAMGTMTVLGAGKVVAYVSSVNLEEVNYHNAKEVLNAKDTLGAVPKVPQQFLNGIAFENGYLSKTDGVDENNNTVQSHPEVSISYGRGVFLDISNWADMAEAEIPAALSRQVGNISMKAYEENYLFLPSEDSLTAEDKALEEAGKLRISYGTDTVQRQTFRCVKWTDDGLVYTLGTSDANIELDELLNMAEEVLAVQ